MTSKWLIDFKGRNDSSSVNVNFLWNNSNVYIMDNHRCALWCWMQHIKGVDSLDLIHIDAHTDMDSEAPSEIDNFPNLEILTLSEYLQASWRPEHLDEDTPLFTYGDFLGFFLEVYKSKVNTYRFVKRSYRTQEINKEDDSLVFIDLWEMQFKWGSEGGLSNLFENNTKRWICDVDLDFFFYDK